MMIKRAYIFILFLFSAASALACTSFVLGNENLLFAKNLDWEIDRGYLCYNQRGIEKTSISDPSLSWVAAYRSITNNQFGKDFPLGGMNEAGLIIEELSLFGQPYAYEKGKHLLNEFQWVQYQLDHSASVEDVIRSLDSITIRHDIMNLHYLIADRSGERAVIECLEEGIKIYRDDALPYPVLSNNPYLNTLTYLTFFDGYGGDMPVRHRSGSQERFVSAVYFLDHDDHDVDPVADAFMILDAVKQEDTRWQFVYDPVGTVLCKTHCSPETRVVRFGDLQKIKHNRWSVPLFTEQFKKEKMTSKENEAQLKFVYENLNEYFPGKEHIYKMMIEEGKRSLKQR